MSQAELEAILRLYEAHFDPDAYKDALTTFGAAFPDVWFGFQVEEMAPRRFSFDSVFVNMDDDTFTDYAKVAHVNPFMDVITRYRTSTRLYYSEECISRKDIKSTEFYDFFFRPRGRMDSGYGFNIFWNPTCISLFTATLPERLSDADRAQVYQSVERIRPHVLRSFRMVRDLMERTARAQAAGIIDRVGTPVAAFDTAHRLVVQNAMAEAFFRAGGELSLSRGGTLIAREKATADRLDAAAGQVVAATLPVGPIRVARPFQPPLILYFVPAGGAGRVNPIIDPFKEGFPAYLVYILDPEDVDPAPTEVLTSALGLTPAEARLARHLHDGKSVKEAAEFSTITYATARNQLTAISRKLNLSRQSELIGLLARLMARIPK